MLFSLLTFLFAKFSAIDAFLLINSLLLFVSSPASNKGVTSEFTFSSFTSYAYSIIELNFLLPIILAIDIMITITKGAIIKRIIPNLVLAKVIIVPAS